MYPHYKFHMTKARLEMEHTRVRRHRNPSQNSEQAQASQAGKAAAAAEANDWTAADAAAPEEKGVEDEE